VITEVMSTSRQGEVAQLGLVGPKEERRRGTVANPLCTPPAARPQAIDRDEGDRMVRLNGSIGVGDEHVGREGADGVGDLVERVGVDLQQVVAEVQAAEARPARRRQPRPRRGGCV
jgi:hypothetical protein